MQTVYKYPLSTTLETQIEMPKSAEILRVDTQNGVVCLWAKVNPDEKKEPRTFEVFGSGHPMPDFNRRFINTFLVDGGEYVFHAFERIY